MKYLYFGITDYDLFRLSEYLYENNYSDSVLGFKLSFGNFKCEVIETSDHIYKIQGNEKWLENK